MFYVKFSYLIENFFNENGFEIIPVTSMLSDCFFKKGFYNEEFFFKKIKRFCNSKC